MELRVRDLRAKAAAAAPPVTFLDERVNYKWTAFRAPRLAAFSNTSRVCFQTGLPFYCTFCIAECAVRYDVLIGADVLSSTDRPNAHKVLPRMPANSASGSASGGVLQPTSSAATRSSGSAAPPPAAPARRSSSSAPPRRPVVVDSCLQVQELRPLSTTERSRARQACRGQSLEGGFRGGE